MNIENQRALEPAAPVPAADAPGSAEPQPQPGPQSNPECTAIPRRRRTGKIASLPKPIRDQINRWLQDGLSYRVIIEKLTAPGADPLPYALSENCLTAWKNGGYQDWLNDQFWAEEMRSRHESFTGVFNGSDAIQLPEGGLQLAAMGVCELLRGLSETSPDPDKFIRAANSLARLSRSILQLQQYRDACARARAALQPLKDPNRELTTEERRALVREVDKILGLDPDYRPVPGQNGLVSIRLDTHANLTPQENAKP